MARNHTFPAIISLLAFSLLLLSAPLLANIIHVPNDQQTIQAGIDHAEVGDTVLVQPGVYHEHIDFSGKNIVVGSLYLTTDDRQFIGETIIQPGNHSSVVAFANGETKDAAIVGFTLTGGVADAGGGVYCQGANPRIIGCIISRNSGSGVVCRNACPQISGCIISDNGVNNGAGMYVLGGPSNPVITDCQFLRNTAGFVGGGLLVGMGATATLTRCSFYDNTGEESGHAIYGSRAVIRLFNCTIGKQAIDWQWHTSAIAIVNTRLDIINCNIWAGWGSRIDASGEEASNNEYNISYSDIEGGREAIHEDQGDQINWGEGNIDADPLFVDPDNGDFHLTANFPCIDSGDPDSPPDLDGTRTDMGAYHLPQLIHCIALEAGWDIISSCNQPRTAAMPTVWSDIVSREHLVMVKDQLGNFFIPGMNFNNMPPWDVRQGYFAKLNDPDTLVIVNVPEAADTPIPLMQDWNIVSYFPEAEVAAPEAFANLGDNLILAKDELGNFYYPRIQFSNLGNLKRGKGYQVDVAQAMDLVWNVPERRQDQVEVKIEVKREHFRPVERTAKNMSLLLSAECRVQSAEWEIGVFTEKGLCVGAATIPDHSSLFTLHSSLGLAVWGDDPTTPELDGAAEGEALEFRLWDGSGERRLSVAVHETGDKNVAPPRTIAYHTDGFAMGTLDVGAQGLAPLPTHFALEEPYPNPFNSATRISFGLPEASLVKLQIFDLSGRKIASLVDGEFAAGRHTVIWVADSAPTGVYLLKMQAGEYNAVTKVALVK